MPALVASVGFVPIALAGERVWRQRAKRRGCYLTVSRRARGVRFGDLATTADSGCCEALGAALSRVGSPRKRCAVLRP